MRLEQATDEGLAALLGDLPESWARLPADDGGEDLAFAFIRAAYGRGYMDALEEDEA